MLVKDLRSVATPALAGGGDVPVRWTVLTATDIPSLRAVNPRLSEAEMLRRWEEGQECIGGWIKDSLAHYRWDTGKRAYLPYLKRVFEPLEGDILVSEAFTHPASRGQGLHSLSTALAFHRARERGFTRSITMVAWWNAAALRVVLEKARRVIAGTVGYWELGFATRHFVTGAVQFNAAGHVYVAHSARSSVA